MKNGLALDLLIVNDLLEKLRYSHKITDILIGRYKCHFENEVSILPFILIGEKENYSIIPASEEWNNILQHEKFYKITCTDCHGKHVFKNMPLYSHVKEIKIEEIDSQDEAINVTYKVVDKQLRRFILNNKLLELAYEQYSYTKNILDIVLNRESEIVSERIPTHEILLKALTGFSTRDTESIYLVHDEQLNVKSKLEEEDKNKKYYKINISDYNQANLYLQYMLIFYYGASYVSDFETEIMIHDSENVNKVVFLNYVQDSLVSISVTTFTREELSTEEVNLSHEATT